MPIPIEGIPGANIMIVGDCPCYEDNRTGKNFSGTSGRVMDMLFAEAGISRHECLVTTVAKDCPPGGKINYFYSDPKLLSPTLNMQIYIAKLREEIEFYRPNIIIALGHVPMHVLTGQVGISKFRGYIAPCTLVPGVKVLPTYHPAQVTSDWKLSFQFIMDIRKAIANSGNSKPVVDTRTLDINYSYSQFMSYLDFLIHDHTGKTALDIETTSPGSHIDIMGLADSPDHGVSFEILSNRHAKYSSQQEYFLWKKIAELCQTKPIIMQNGLYDAAVMLHHYGFWSHGWKYDTLLAAHSCWPECPRSLNFLGSICLNVPSWKHTQNESPLLYNAADACNTFGIWEVLESQMDLLGTRATHDFEIEQCEVAVMLQLQGIHIDQEKQAQIKYELKQKVANLQTEIESDCKKKINFSSPKQMAELLYKDLGFPKQYKRRKSQAEERKVTTDEEALVKLSRTSNDPVLGKILSIKKAIKLLTFIDVDISPDSNVHTCYNVTGATMLRENKGIAVDDEDDYRSFGRWSSSGSIILPYGSGNLQNIPKDARKMYTAPPGYIFVQADYKQAEAVVVAYLIGDQRLKKLFQDSFGLSDEECKVRNLDVHKITAAMVYNLPIEAVTPEHRKVGKTLRHAINYSAGPAVLASKLNISTKDAKHIMSLFHSACPQLQMWQMRIQDELKRTRCLTNLLGRKHRFLDRWGDSLFRSAYSYIPQSTVGDLLNSALIRLYDNYSTRFTIALQLHDAIYCIGREDQEEEIKSALRESMYIPLKYKDEEFMIDVDFKVGKSWGELGD